MPSLTVTASQVAAVEIVEQITAPAGVAISAGEVVRLATTNGYFQLANATNTANRGEQAWIAIRSDRTNGSVTAVRQGIIDFGKGTLTSLNYGVKVYMSDVAGNISNTVGTVSTGCAVIGTVEPSFGHTTADKVLRVNIRPQNHAG